MSGRNWNNAGSNDSSLSLYGQIIHEQRAIGLYRNSLKDVKKNVPRRLMLPLFQTKVSHIAAIIERAIADLKGPETRATRCVKDDIDQAMAFILSDTCEDYCLELEIDIEAAREIAAALYQKIIAREEKPRKARYADTPGLFVKKRRFPAGIAQSKNLAAPGKN
jgi:hypothetical protein